MMDRKIVKQYVVPFALATSLALLLAIIIIMLVNTSLSRMPLVGDTSPFPPSTGRANKETAKTAENSDVILKRNLFRAKLQAEVPKPRDEREIEEETIVNALRSLVLKGIWVGQGKGDSLAIIDKGAQKGVWIYKQGEQLEGGLVVSEIKPNSILLTKGDFGATLTLFTKGFQRTIVKKTDLLPNSNTGKEARKNKE
jgi:type II secretory pathway component PulC